ETELGGADLRGFDRLLTDLDTGDSPNSVILIVSVVASRPCTVESEPADTAVEIPQAAGLHRVDPLRDLIVEADGHGGVRLEEALRAQVQIDPVEVHPQRSAVQHLLTRSEEHTSELQSRFDLVCRLLLEKKNI